MSHKETIEYFKPRQITVNLDDVTIVGDNPNEMTAQQMQSLEYSIDNFEQVQPILVDQDLNLVDGHQRVEVLKKKGVKEVMAVQKFVKDKKERQLMIQALNKIHGQHDPELDAAIFYSQLLEDENNVLGLMAVNVEEDPRKIQELVQKYHPEYEGYNNNNVNRESDEDLDNLPDPKSIKEPITKIGDLWQLGNHYLLCGDCTNNNDIDKLLHDVLIDLLLTDPPYGANYGKQNKKYNSYYGGNRLTKSIENDDYSIDMYPLIKNCLEDLPFSQNNMIFVFMSSQHLHTVRSVFDHLNLTFSDYLIWVKNNHVMGFKDYKLKHEFIVYGWKNEHKFYGDFSTTILEYDRPVKSELHPVMKPIELLEKLIEDGSQKNMVVYDPFMGSGSTLIACEQTNRKCYGIEISPQYVQVCLQRWVNLAGGNPIRLNDGKKFNELV